MPSYATRTTQTERLGSGSTRPPPAPRLQPRSTTCQDEPHIRDLDLRAGRDRVPPPPLLRLGQLSGRAPRGARASPTRPRARSTTCGAAFLAAGASAVIADGHSHTGCHLDALFTTTESLSDLWHGAPDHHGHDIPFTPDPEHRQRHHGSWTYRRGRARPASPLARSVGDLELHDAHRDRREAAARRPRDASAGAAVEARPATRRDGGARDLMRPAVRRGRGGRPAAPRPRPQLDADHPGRIAAPTR